MLSGKVILITGASRGIGRATAVLAASHHAHVIVNYLHHTKEAEDLVQEIKGQGFSASKVCCDVSNQNDVGMMFKNVQEKFGRLDILVNNAGIMKNSLLMMTKVEEYQAVMDINCKGVFLCTQHAAKIMMRQKSGKIINLSSIVGIFGNKGQVAYASSKSFVLGLTKSSAKELGPFNITVNAVAPGFIETDLQSATRPEVRAEFLKNIALGRFGKPEDVAKVILFLSSDLSDYVSGQVISVDGCESL